MDWATILKDYPALIPAFATLMVAVLGYFFVRWNSTHNKNLEIEKNEYDRRASIHDMRIKEAREVVELLHNAINMFSIIGDSADTQSLHHNILYFRETFGDRLDTMSKEAFNKSASIMMKTDKELNNLGKEFFITLLPCVTSLTSLFEKTIRGEPITNRDELIRVSECAERLYKINIKMKIRIDELAKTVE